MSAVGTLALLVHVASIGDSVLAHAERSSHQGLSGAEAEAATASFIGEIEARLRQWQGQALLPRPDSSSAVDRFVGDGVSAGKGVAITMQAMYETTLMMLYRFVRWHPLAPDRVAEHIRRSRRHAWRLLETVENVGLHHAGGAGGGAASAYLAGHERSLAARPSLKPPTPPSAPRPAHFVEYGIRLAWDTLSARGLQRQIPRLLRSAEAAMRVLDELRPFWRCARTRMNQMTERISQLEQKWQQAGDFNAHVSGGDGSTFEFRQPLVAGMASRQWGATGAAAARPAGLTHAEAGMDVIYGTPMEMCLTAMTAEE
jgi:hypothetical protein